MDYDALVAEAGIKVRTGTTVSMGETGLGERTNQ
jgi:hypothetical protein